MNKKINIMFREDERLHQSGPMEYFGYFADNSPVELKELEQEGVNCVSPNNVIYQPEIKDGISVDPCLLGKKSAVNFKQKFSGSGLSFDICLGGWNNGLFNYLPDWYIEKHPGMVMTDHHGDIILASMMGKPKPWINIEYGPYLAEIEQFMKGFIEEFGSDERMVYWVTGGEMLYPTYVYPNRTSDYSFLAQEHFRAWLKNKYVTINELRRHWHPAEAVSDFSGITAPMWEEKSPKGLDWHDFRLYAMAEYFQKQYQTLLSTSSGKPLLSILHGDMFHDRTYTEMGQSIYLMSSVSDGLATSQILFNMKKPNLNLLYLQFITSTGKLGTSQALACVSPPSTGQVINNSFTPWDVRKAVYECLGMGIWHAGLVQWKGHLPDGNWQISGTVAQQEVSKIAGELASMNAELKGMARVKPSVGILYSEATWILDGWLPEWTLLHKAALGTHIPYLTLFDAGLNDQLESGDIQFIVVPYATCIRPEVGERLGEFVRRGGYLILLDDGQELATFVGHQSMGWKLPFSTNQFQFKQQDASHRYQAALSIEGKGEILWIRSKFNRLFLERIFYAQETQILQMWQYAVKWIKEKQYAQPLLGVPSQVESFLLSDGNDLVCVFINSSVEDVEFGLSFSKELVNPWIDAEITDLLEGDILPALLNESPFPVSLKGYSTRVFKVRLSGKNTKDIEADGISIMVIDQSRDSLLLKVLDSNGMAGENLHVTGKAAPLFDYPMKASCEENGTYRFNLNREQLPMVYDHTRQCYADYQGPIKLKVKVKRENGEHAAFKSFIV
ncbi:MAG TPA: beta-galactosidase [Bacilli bacterium]